MATTTPNFGWAVPTSTDLVKDGAVAIETLGDSIDASLVDLKGGTTGQILAKASGTDMDFTWVSDAAGMTNPMTTTGDIIYSSPGSTPVRRGIGSTGQVLTVSGGVPTWATPAGGGGKVLQVVSSAITTETTIASTTFTDTGITATITPTSSTSKILVMIMAQSSISTSNTNDVPAAGVKLQRGGSDIMTIGSDKNSYQRLRLTSIGVIGEMANVAPVIYLDSPATTSATTYKLQSAVATTSSSCQIRFNWYTGQTTTSTITLMEIGA
jgi:hypothetical protein